MKRTAFWYFESELLLENLEVVIKKLQRNFEFLKFAYIEALLSNNFDLLLTINFDNNFHLLSEYVTELLFMQWNNGTWK